VPGQDVSWSGLQGDARSALAMDGENSGAVGPASPHISLNIVCAMSTQAYYRAHCSCAALALHLQPRARTSNSSGSFMAHPRCSASRGDTALSLFHSCIEAC
jgi:hypothetical protein